MIKSSRRTLLAAAAAPLVAGSSLALAKGDRDGATPMKPVKKLTNKAFYKPDGAFDANATKKAYLDMMRAFGYPIPPVLKTDELWVCDFLQRDMANLGMGGIFWVNETGQYDQTGAESTQSARAHAIDLPQPGQQGAHRLSGTEMLPAPSAARESCPDRCRSRQ